MEAHTRYKLVEAAGRFMFAGAEVVRLSDGRIAIAVPDEVAPLIGQPEHAALADV